MARRLLCVMLVLLIAACACACSTAAEEAQTSAEVPSPGTGDAQQTDDVQTASPERTDTGHKALVAYFSATGNTRKAAESIAEAIDGVLFEIVPTEPYTEADLEYQDENSRSMVEQSDDEARPAIADEPIDIRQYDVVYLGYPIWAGKAPRIIYTFLESNDLSGMKVVPFCTSGSTGISGSEEELKAQFPNIDWQPGERVTPGDEKVAEWSDELGFWPFGDL